MLKYDSVHKGLDAEVSHHDGKLIVNGKAITVFSEYVPHQVPTNQQAIHHLIKARSFSRQHQRPALHYDFCDFFLFCFNDCLLGYC
jgi:glyceraldehyde 3-phosphate dehydrogenase